MLGLICYTFVTMVGGNPDHWAYGFTYWKNPVSRNKPIFTVFANNYCASRAHLSSTSFLETLVASSDLFLALFKAPSRQYPPYTWLTSSMADGILQYGRS